jgi:hypothetical protein
MIYIHLLTWVDFGLDRVCTKQVVYRTSSACDFVRVEINPKLNIDSHFTDCQVQNQEDHWTLLGDTLYTFKTWRTHAVPNPLNEVRK